jgi:hypothetical protein
VSSVTFNGDSHRQRFVTNLSQSAHIARDRESCRSD